MCIRDSISTASLDLGTKIMLPNSDSEGKDSVDLIRRLFLLQNFKHNIQKTINGICVQSLCITQIRHSVECPVQYLSLIHILADALRIRYAILITGDTLLLSATIIRKSSAR